MPNRPHLKIPNSGQLQSYKYNGPRPYSKPKNYDDYRGHGATLQKSFEEGENTTLQTEDGKFFTFIVHEGFLVAQQETPWFKILDEKIDDEANKTYKILVWLPSNKVSKLINQIHEYQTKFTKAGNPQKQALLDSIANILQTTISDFCYIDEMITSPSTPRWCELWCYRESSWTQEQIFKNFVKNAEDSEISQYSDKPLIFPSRFIINILASLEQITSLIQNGELVTAINPIPVLNSEFLNMSSIEQQEWTDDLEDRLNPLPENAPIIGLLDHGILSSHRLLKRFIASAQALEDWSPDDTNKPHGTLMAGTILYDDLKVKLLSRDLVIVPFRLASLKLINPDIYTPDDESRKKIYGYVTAKGISLIEIAHPSTSIYCMAVTAPLLNTSKKTSIQTSWSSAIDQLAYGLDIEGSEEDKKQRLILISAGNAYPDENKGRYPHFQQLSMLEDPSQAYNAVTVGGYTDIPPSDSTLLVPQGGISPHSKTGGGLENFKNSPFKPDIVCEAGSVVYSGGQYLTDENTSIFTTDNHDTNLFTCYTGTSPATAQATHIAGQIQSKYPEYWPETIRALLIHSAEWTEALKKHIFEGKLHSKIKGDYKTLLFYCGYGVPNLERALNSVENKVSLIIEDELQPYIKESSNVKYNEYKLYELPLPEFQRFSSEFHSMEARMKITLSYFIEPLPEGLSTNYHSCGLDFYLQSPAETEAQFKQRVSKRQDGDTIEDKISDTDRWTFGINNRKRGSISSDMWKGTLSDLLSCKNIAIIPRAGWWKDRIKQEKYNNKIRYSLIISIDTEANIPLYTEIENLVSITTPITI